MKLLFVITAVLEAATGLSLLGLPLLVGLLLLGESLDTPAALMVARVGGAGLLSIGVACWLARNDQQSRAAAGLASALLLYNVTAVSILTYGGLGLGFSGIGLWPAVVVHAALAVWCVVCVWPRKM